MTHDEWQMAEMVSNFEPRTWKREDFLERIPAGEPVEELPGENDEENVHAAENTSEGRTIAGGGDGCRLELFCGGD